MYGPASIPVLEEVEPAEGRIADGRRERGGEERCHPGVETEFAGGGFLVQWSEYRMCWYSAIGRGTGFFLPLGGQRRCVLRGRGALIDLREEGSVLVFGYVDGDGYVG